MNNANCDMQASDCTLNTSHFSAEQVLGLVMLEAEPFDDLPDQIGNFEIGENSQDITPNWMSNSKTMQDRKQDALEYFPKPHVNKPYVDALYDYMDDHGILEKSVIEIANAADLLPDHLELARLKLCEGPVLGEGSLNSREFKFHLMKYLIEKRMSRTTSNQNILRSHRQRVRKIEQLTDCQLTQLYRLTKELSCIDNMPRKLTARNVKELIGGDDESADILHRAYKTLPSYPLV